MQLTATFAQASYYPPLEELTADQATGWLLGQVTSPIGIGSSLLASFGVRSMVDRLASTPDREIEVRRADGSMCLVTCNVYRSGPFGLRRTPRYLITDRPVHGGSYSGAGAWAD